MVFCAILATFTGGIASGLTALGLWPIVLIALGRPAERRMRWLGAAAPDRYARIWRPPGVPALQNAGYAVQWGPWRAQLE